VFIVAAALVCGAIIWGKTLRFLELISTLIAQPMMVNMSKCVSDHKTPLNFWPLLLRKWGGGDVVLDDGSHRMEHVRASLTALYPKLEMGGTYMIEDLHTSYYRGFGGGFRGKGNFFLMVRDIIDDMHHWYHAQDIQHPNLLDALSGIHVHDSIVVLDKNQCHRPTFSLVPK
jgi:hypothetical protein